MVIYPALLFIALAAFATLIGLRVRSTRREALGRPRPAWPSRLAGALLVLSLTLFILHAFLVEPFRVTSGSMLPTLQVDDFVLVDKSAYGARLPYVGARLPGLGASQRGDVIVFDHPRDRGRVSVKRLLGLPGDRVVYRDKHLTINDAPVSRSLRGYHEGRGVTRYLDGAGVYEERLDSRSYRVFVMGNDVVPPDDFDLVVPEDSYLVLGDNRDNSDDSRDWGVVPRANLIGRVFFILRFR